MCNPLGNIFIKVQDQTYGVILLNFYEDIIHPQPLGVRIQHPQFVPLYTELHHYYESSMNTYSNDKEHIFIQIPIYFAAANQKPMNLFRIHTMPVPLDIDTYNGKESKYTTLDLQYKYLATNGQE